MSRLGKKGNENKDWGREGLNQERRDQTSIEGTTQGKTNLKRADPNRMDRQKGKRRLLDNKPKRGRC